MEQYRAPINWRFSISGSTIDDHKRPFSTATALLCDCSRGLQIVLLLFFWIQTHSELVRKEIV